MGFLQQFSTYFTAEEKKTELYALWSAIGTNTEKAILEEQTKLNNSQIDINSFDEDTTRSWLAYFLHKTPYRTSAKCSLTVTLKSNTGLTHIPKYTVLRTEGGKKYIQLDDLYLVKDTSRTITVVEGSRIVETGTYSTMIKVKAVNPDMDYISLSINGEEVPPASWDTSYDSLSYKGSWSPFGEGSLYGSPELKDGNGNKGEFYTVIADGVVRFSEQGVVHEFKKGDLVVFDGNYWQRSAYTNQLQPLQFQNTYVIPHNVYFAYYYGGYLYVKVYLGPLVHNPEGMDYELSYISSSGVQGRIDANTLEYGQTFYDVDENESDIEVSNTASTIGVNEPGIGKLGLYLKHRLYSGINISSVPEYTSWFMGQPEVGDVMVLGDWERYLKAGEIDLKYTNMVYVYLVDASGEVMDSQTVKILFDRIKPYKDIAVLKSEPFREIKHYVICTFTGADNPDAFVPYAKAEVGLHYDLDYMHRHGYSLFNDLDMTKVYQSFLDDKTQNFRGLTLNGYHFDSRVVSNTSKSVTLESFEGEKLGDGFYELEIYDGDELVETKTLYEDMMPGEDTYALIYLEGETGDIIRGRHEGNIVHLDLSGIDWEGNAILKCYWGMIDKGNLVIGIQNGIRRLEGVRVIMMEE